MKVNDRLDKLQNHYPPESFESYKDLLLQVINRDYNRINRYTKAIAMYRISEITDEVENAIVANLFNPDPLLAQTAAYVIYKQNRAEYHEHTKRLKVTTKKELDKAILPPVFRSEEEEYHQKLLLIERIIELKKVEIFSHIPGEIITYFAECFDEVKVKLGTSIINEGDSGWGPMYVVLEGEVDIYRGDNKEVTLSKGEVFGERHLVETVSFDFTALARTDCTLLTISKEELTNIISRYSELLNAWIDILNKKTGKTKKEELVEALFT